MSWYCDRWSEWEPIAEFDDFVEAERYCQECRDEVRDHYGVNADYYEQYRVEE